MDLSQPYLVEAARHLKGLRGAELIEAAAESDAAASEQRRYCHLHLPVPRAAARGAPAVAAEMARVLKPGGLLVFLDSLQMGDRPGWDGLLEAFPHRFHEPYYRHYAIDDLDGIFTAAGLELARPRCRSWRS